LEGYKQTPIAGDNWGHLLEVFEGWEAACRKDHQICAEHLNKPAQFLPTRLIEIKSDEDGNEAARLVLTKDLEERSVRYMTLSHRWGPVELMSSTTSENLEKRLSAIDSLSLTFY
jgi:hypothetical protein